MRPDVTAGAALSPQKGRQVSSWPGHKWERFQGREGASGQSLSGDVQLSENGWGPFPMFGSHFFLLLCAGKLALVVAFVQCVSCPPPSFLSLLISLPFSNVETN